MKRHWKRYLVYLIRWQLSTPLLAPIVSMFRAGSLSLAFGGQAEWVGAAVANLIGGLLFYWVDYLTFRWKLRHTQDDLDSMRWTLKLLRVNTRPETGYAASRWERAEGYLEKIQRALQ